LIYHRSHAPALIVKHKSVIPAGIHVRLSCLTPFGLMQICSKQICAGIQTIWKYLSSPSLSTTLRTSHGTGYPLPGGYDELPCNCVLRRALRLGNAVCRDVTIVSQLQQQVTQSVHKRTCHLSGDNGRGLQRTA
jgi:hypothetical protein